MSLMYPKVELLSEESMFLSEYPIIPKNEEITTITDKLDRVLELDNKDNPVDSLIVMDLSWVLYRSWYSYKRLTAGPGGRPTGHIFGVLKSLTELREAKPNSVIILCKDGIPRKRQHIMTSSGLSYKAGRPELEYDFYQDLPVIINLAYALPRVYLAEHPTLESDDIMYCLSKQSVYLNPNLKCFVFSGDNDLLQSIDSNISVVRSITNKTLDILDVESKYPQYPAPQDIPVYRAITGDSSDKIPGIYRFPRKLAKQLSSLTINGLYSYPIESIMSMLNLSSTSAKYILTLKQSYSQVIRNYILMKLTVNLNPHIHRKNITNSNALIQILDRFYLSSYRRYLGI